MYCRSSIEKRGEDFDTGTDSHNYDHKHHHQYDHGHSKICKKKSKHHKSTQKISSTFKTHSTVLSSRRETVEVISLKPFSVILTTFTPTVSSTKVSSKAFTFSTTSTFPSSKQVLAVSSSASLTTFIPSAIVSSTRFSSVPSS